MSVRLGSRPEALSDDHRRLRSGSRTAHLAQFADGVGINTIVKALNRERIKGRRKAAGGWTPSAVSQILRNEKYIGRSAWTA